MINVPDCRRSRYESTSVEVFPTQRENVLLVIKSVFFIVKTGQVYDKRNAFCLCMNWT